MNDWTDDDYKDFRTGLKKMGFKAIKPGSYGYQPGMETWSFKLGPVKGKELKRAARTKSTTRAKQGE